MTPGERTEALRFTHELLTSLAEGQSLARIAECARAVEFLAEFAECTRSLDRKRR